MKKMREFGEKLQNNPFVIGGFIFGIVIVIVTALWFFVLRKTANMDIVVAPESAVVIIDGSEYNNGVHRFVPGTYEVAITKDGFTPYSGTVTLEQGKTEKLYVYLLQEDGSYQWYFDNPNDYRILTTIKGAEAAEAANEYAKSDLIFSVTPYYDGQNRFTINAKKTDGKNTVLISFNTCAEASISIYKNAALAWLKSKSVDIDGYNIEYSSLCD